MTKRDTKDTMWKGAPSRIFTNAQALRERMTPAEKLLWEELRNKKFMGLKFRRQHPILLYIVDFYCHSMKLVIEIDGGYHLSKKQQLEDNERTENLNFNGIKVIRFTNDQVEKKMDEVLAELKVIVKQLG